MNFDFIIEHLLQRLTPLLPTEIDDVESKLNRLVSGASGKSLLYRSKECPGCPRKGPYCTGKVGKMFFNKSIRENTGNLDIWPKHREFCMLK